MMTLEQDPALYEVAWRNLAQYAILPEGRINREIERSWQRCHDRKQNPFTLFKPPVLEPATLATRQRRLTGQLSIGRTILEDVYEPMENSGVLLIFSDNTGVLIEILGDAPLAREMAELGICKGASLAEDHAGTNAISLALATGGPVALSGAAHFYAALHNYYGTAAPIYDLLGNLLGTFGLFCDVTQGNRALLGLVTTAARAMSMQLQTDFWLSDATLRLEERNAILRSLSEGLLVLTKDGGISHVNPKAEQLLGVPATSLVGAQLELALGVPPLLHKAIRNRLEFQDEEFPITSRQGRVLCVCTLKTLPNQNPDRAGFVLNIRAAEKVHKLIHRVTGARAHLTFAHILGESKPLQKAIRLARSAASSSVSVLLQGETGTGKELFAQSIHNSSARATGPFLAINCAAIPRELIASELFGYEGGAFTGADKQGRPGKFELANGGTLFLDEIGDMPLDLQASLLRALETKTIMRLSSQHVTQVDVRVIAATHHNLPEAVQQGAFRSDLYYRLNVFPISIPSLRERGEDIALLSKALIEKFNRELGKDLQISSDTLAILQTYSWPGNVRELANTIEHLMYLCEGAIIRAEDLPEPIGGSASAQAPVRELPVEPERAPAESTAANPSSASNDRFSAVTPVPAQPPQSLLSRKEFEHQALLDAWKMYGGNREKVAGALGMSRTTLWRKLRELQREGLQLDPVVQKEFATVL